MDRHPATRGRGRPLTHRRSIAVFRRSIGPVLFVLSVILLALQWPPTSTADDAPPLTSVDIVRRVIAGDSADSLIALIRGSAAVEFDLTDEMQEELGIAGVPQAVIRAMVERQSELVRAGDPNPSEDASTDRASEVPSITILVESDLPPEQQPAELRLIDLVPPPMREQLSLREEPARFTDIGLFLVCLTADHVPDHWRSHTPLGRDFVRTPRHKLLFFLSGADSVADPELSERVRLPEGATPPGLLRLEMPAQIEAALDPDVAHDLALGIALQSEERFYIIVSAAWEGLVPTRRIVTHARIRSGDDPLDLSLEVAFDHSADQGVDPPNPN